MSPEAELATVGGYGQGFGLLQLGRSRVRWSLSRAAFPWGLRGRPHVWGWPGAEKGSLKNVGLPSRLIPSIWKAGCLPDVALQDGPTRRAVGRALQPCAEVWLVCFLFFLLCAFLLLLLLLLLLRPRGARAPSLPSQLPTIGSSSGWPTRA